MKLDEDIPNDLGARSSGAYATPDLGRCSAESPARVVGSRHADSAPRAKKFANPDNHEPSSCCRSPTALVASARVMDSLLSLLDAFRLSDQVFFAFATLAV